MRWIKKLVELTIVDISSMISLLTKTEPIKACSASMLDGCLLFIEFLMDLISFI